MNFESLRKVVDDALVAIEGAMTAANQIILEAKNVEATQSEAKTRLEERQKKLEAGEARMMEEKRYLLMIRKQQEAKDLEQLTFTEKKKLVDEGMKQLEAKKAEISEELSRLTGKKAEINGLIDALNENKKLNTEVLEERKKFLDDKEKDLMTREEADVERKKLLDVREKKLKMRETRLQQYADMK